MVLSFPNGGRSTCKLLLLFVLLACGLPGVAQNNILIFSEDFESSQNSANLNINAAGTTTNSGNNTWIINNSYTGGAGYPNTTSQINTAGGGSISFPNQRYLHIHDSQVAPSPDNANYNNANASDRLTSLTGGICTKSFTNVRFAFWYVAEGSTNAFFEVFYRADGGPWTKTGQNQYNSQTLWRYEVITDPGFSNRTNLEFAFRWVNNAGSGTPTISAGIDDVFVLADFLPGAVTMNITQVPDSVCQGLNIPFSVSISDTLCGGQYSVELINGGAVVNTWGPYNFPPGFNNFNLTLGVGQTNYPLDPCYQIRINRTGPPPVFSSTLSACFPIVACPNTINTLQPAVTIGSEFPGGPDVCVGSVIDVPFWSTGSFLPGNVYTAELSDASGGFASPQTIGTFSSALAFDPQVVPSPGSISGIVPVATDGCGYYIRVVSSNPTTTGSVWGPFCLENCDIETNNRQDISFCISSVNGDTDTVAYDINTPTALNTYLAGNLFQMEVLDPQTFAQVNAPGTIGQTASTTSGNIQVNIPQLPVLLANPYNMAAGLYYTRVISTNSNDPDLDLGTLIRMTIGAPFDGALNININPDTVCAGEIIVNTVFPYNQASDYEWFLNGNPFSTNYPLGFFFNAGAAPGPYELNIQETNYGCLGPFSPPDTVWLITSPSTSITGPQLVCQGDTSVYTVPFVAGTAYGWSLVPANAGSVVLNGNNQVSIAWDSTYTGVVTIDHFASNRCGQASATYVVSVNASPEVDAGADQIVCNGESVTLGGNPVVSGGQFPFLYLWSPSTGLSSSTAPNPGLTPTDTTTYVLVVTDNNQCRGTDTVTIFTTNQAPLSLVEDTLKCFSDTVLLDPGYTGSGSLTWSTGANSPTITVQDTGWFWVEVTGTSGSGCGGRDSIRVRDFPRISFSLGPDTSVCGTEHDLDAMIEDQSYQWSTGDTGQVLTVTRTDDYWVEVSNQCETQRDSIYVVIIDEQEGYLLPNVFTPNNDGANDFFTTETGVPIENFVVRIYNRWGKLMYTSTDQRFRWDGRQQNGEPAVEGVYYYIITAVDCKGETFDKPGTLTLLR